MGAMSNRSTAALGFGVGWPYRTCTDDPLRVSPRDPLDTPRYSPDLVLSGVWSHAHSPEDVFRKVTTRCQPTHSARA